MSFICDGKEFHAARPTNEKHRLPNELETSRWQLIASTAWYRTQSGDEMQCQMSAGQVLEDILSFHPLRAAHNC